MYSTMKLSMLLPQNLLKLMILLYIENELNIIWNTHLNKIKFDVGIAGKL